MRDGPISQDQALRFRQLVWPMLPMLLRTAQYLTRDSQQAEDLAQETMIKAMRAIDSYQDGTNLKAWLLTILRRTHIDQLRVGRNRPNEVSVASDVLQESVAVSDDPVGIFDQHWDEPQDLMRRFEDDTIIEALGELPDDIRWTLLLVDVQQIEQVEAATILNVAVGTIKSRTYRGRRMLRDRLYQLALQRGWVAAREAMP